MSIRSYTPNFSLGLIDYDSQNWHDDEHANWTLVDALIAGIDAPAIFGVMATTGTPSQWTMTASGVVSYFSGLRLTFKATQASQTNQTINVNGLGQINMRLPANTNLSNANTILINDIVEMIYDGATFVVLAPQRVVPSLTVQQSGDASLLARSTSNRAIVSVVSDSTTKDAVSRISSAGSEFNTKVNSTDAKVTMNFTTPAGGGASINKIELTSDDFYTTAKSFRFDNADLGTKFSINGQTNGEVTFRFLSGSANGFIIKRTGSTKFLAPVEFPVYTVATLPAAASNTYARAFVSDANSPTWNATVAGGGSVKCPVWSDGTNWKVG